MIQKRLYESIKNITDHTVKTEQGLDQSSLEKRIAYLTENGVLENIPSQGTSAEKIIFNSYLPSQNSHTYKWSYSFKHSLKSPKPIVLWISRT